MNRSNVRAVLFDWDGTLVDSAEPTYRVYVRLFGDYGIPFDRDTFARTYSPAWHETYRSLGIAEERWPEADQRWMAYFAGETTNLIGGVVETLETLGSRGIVRGIVTSGTRKRILRELAGFGVEHHFAYVVCGDDGHRRKPHPDALSVCLDRLGIAPHEAAYVGDSAEDVMMARAAGVFSVGVRGMFPNHANLLAAKPDLVADSVADAVTRLFP